MYFCIVYFWVEMSKCYGIFVGISGMINVKEIVILSQYSNGYTVRVFVERNRWQFRFLFLFRFLLGMILWKFVGFLPNLKRNESEHHRRIDGITRKRNEGKMLFIFVLYITQYLWKLDGLFDRYFQENFDVLIQMVRFF